ncbi:PhzF family phenazine biosynthesis protein [Paenibacillus caui]|uniref:PhzF family phenazine biosynthesis protein n=1 Tax=Paenibacillus caui TaxID=2873927 RepID=UPI001CA82FB0|nr:PhzF family phenazine biosynthesis protein [Paenibacillus caui]
MEVQVYTLNAFAKGQLGGNPAGVVLHAGVLSEEDMQKTAQIIGFSETAFIEKSEQADFKVRYFTPNAEVDLCGHATIAAFYLMGSQKRIGIGTYSLETKAGLLEVSFDENGDVFLAQALPQYFEEADKQKIADSLQIRPDELADGLPVQIVSTGLRDILVPVKNNRVLERIQPDFRKIERVSKSYNVIGYHVFTLDASQGAVARCRNFAPLYEIPEESATGTSTGALLCYLHKYGKLPSVHASSFIFEQGYSMNRPSELKARLRADEKQQIVKVQVGGTATRIKLQTINI